MANGKKNGGIEAQIKILSAQLESFTTEIYGYRSDMNLLKEHIDQLLIFRKQFVNRDGWVPKIIDTVTGNFRKDLKLLREEIIGKFDALPCFDLKFAEDEDGVRLKSRCHIANESKPLAENEKELNP